MVLRTIRLERLHYKYFCKVLPLTLISVVATTLSGCGSQALVVSDSYVKTNTFYHKQFKSNDTSVWKPASQFYTKTFDPSVHSAVHNFFINLAHVRYFANNALQGKFINAAEQIARFVVNTLFGLFGMFDVAASLGLEIKPQDFGQTLALWGWRESNYLMIPVLGPSTERDLVGYLVDFATFDPLSYLEMPFASRAGLTFVNAIDTRKQNAATLDFIYTSGVGGSGYSFFKSIWTQDRIQTINQTMREAGIAIEQDSIDDELDSLFDE